MKPERISSLLGAISKLVAGTLALLSLSLNAAAEDVIKESATGGINWTQGVVYAVGYGTAKANTSPAQKRILSDRAAVVDAQRNLLEITQGVRISSVLTTDKAMQESRETASRVEGLIKGAQVTKRTYSNEVATVTMAMPIAGKFLQALLPPEQAQSSFAAPINTNGQRIAHYQIRGQQQLTLGRVQQAGLTLGHELLAMFIPPARAGQSLVIRDESEAKAYKRLLEWMNQADSADISKVLHLAVENYETNNQFSGLLIDASAVPGFELATVPKIRDQDGNVLYPSESTSYDDIINKRGVTYDFDLNDAIRNQRVATTPFVIKALSTYKNLPSDLIIDTRDAARVQQSASTVDAMNKAGVLIVVAI
jgi:hypothetical protein